MRSTHPRAAVVHFRELSTGANPCSNHPYATVNNSLITCFSCLCLVATFFTVFFLAMMTLILGYWVNSINGYTSLHDDIDRMIKD